MKLSKVIILVLIIVAIFLNISAFSLISIRTVEVFSKNNNENINIDDKNKIIQYKEASLVKYTVYGTHLNLDIKLDYDEKLSNIISSKLILRDSDNNDIEYNLEYEIDKESIVFSTSNNINKGINLEDIDNGKYSTFLKLDIYETSDDEEELIKDYYYVLNNSTKYDEVDYYTITRNSLNKKVDIYFEDFFDKSTFCVLVTNCNLPDEVYDIVLDAGHGGADEGASANGYKESELTLKYTLLLKEKLEDLGLKVKLTRDENETRLKTYGDGGRYVVSNEVKAKLLLSLHLNSSNYDEVNGVEIYSPNNADLTFSKALANDLIKKAGSGVSRNNVGKVYDGVYVRVYVDDDIKEAIEYANENNYEPYNLTSNTSYYGIIRETGGICTGAYMDGRNPMYDANPYYNSNVGVETYLIELGYITNKEELENIITNMELYTDIISSNIASYLSLE